jgi:hypothetical protein
MRGSRYDETFINQASKKKQIELSYRANFSLFLSPCLCVSVVNKKHHNTLLVIPSFKSATLKFINKPTWIFFKRKYVIN